MSEENRRDLILYRRIKQMMRDKAPAVEIQSAVSEYVEAQNSEHRDALLDMRRTESLVRNSPAALRDPVYSRLLEGMGVHCSEHLMFRAKEHGLGLDVLASFSVSVSMRTRRKQLNPLSGAEDFLVDKQDAYTFAKALDLPIPHYDGQIYSYKKVPLRAGTVVKPRNSLGGRGVFAIYSPKDIFQIKTSEEWNDGIRALRKRLGDMIESGFVEHDEWVAQEIIFENKRKRIRGRDLKFFCFYGKCALVWEVARVPNAMECWWDSDGNRVFPGKLYAHVDDFEGAGFSKEAYDMALRLSQAVPSPFLRVDILAGRNGPVLCELTEHTGNYDRFHPEYDRILGEAFLDAEARLSRDLLGGKTFEAFTQTFPKAASTLQN